jgi:Tol biopolymer transport system component
MATWSRALLAAGWILGSVAAAPAVQAAVVTQTADWEKQQTLWLVATSSGISVYDGSIFTPITSQGSFPSWTPNGSIIYISTQSGSAQIWLMNADGSGANQISDFAPSMNPQLPQMATNGTIIFQGNDPNLTVPDSNVGIYTIKSDGSGLREIAQGQGPSIALSATWIAYTLTTNPGKPNFHREVWRANIDGSNKKALTFTGDPNYPDAAAPIISPDETTIAIFSGKENNWNDRTQSIFTFGHRDVATIPANGGPRKKLSSCVPVTTQWQLQASTQCIVADDPSLTPDGQWLIFNTIWRTGNQTRMIDANGNGYAQFYPQLIMAPMRVQLRAK